MLNTENGPYICKYLYFLIKYHELSINKDHFSSSELNKQAKWMTFFSANQ